MRALALLVVVTACGDNRPAALGDAGTEGGDDGSSGVDFAFSQSAYDFGRLPANVARAPGVVTITNVGGIAVRFGLSIDGFTIRSTDCVGPVFQPGQSCTVAVDPPEALGIAAGSLAVTAEGQTKSVSLAATVEGVVQLTATGAGAVALSPPSDDCAGVPCYAAGTVVTATATPDAASALYRWSDPSCGTALVCTHTVDASPYALSATFGPSVLTFSLDITGTGAGFVKVYRGPTIPLDEPLMICRSSCTLDVDHADQLVLVAVTPDDFVGFSAPCAPGFACVLPAGTTSATATFDIVPGEVDLYPPHTVNNLDFSTTGDLALSTSQGVIVLDSSYAVRWTSPLVGPVRFASDGGIFVGTSAGVVKLDATGNPLWTYSGWGPAAATPNGGLVVGRSSPTVSFEILDASGAVIAMLPINGGPPCAAVAMDGTIYLGQLSNNLAAFTPDGQPLADAPSLYVRDNLCSLAAGRDQIALSQVSDSSTFFEYQRDTLDGAFVDSGGTGKVKNVLALFNHHVAFDADDDLYWFHANVVDVVDGFAFTGADLTKLTSSATLAWHVFRPSFPWYYDVAQTGLDINAFAVAPDGRSAIAGVFHSYPDPDRGIIEIFPP